MTILVLAMTNSLAESLFASSINDTPTAPLSDSVHLQKTPEQPEAKFRLQGFFQLETDKPLAQEIIRDDHQLSGKASYKTAYLPTFKFPYLQDGKYLIPAERGAIRGSHPFWQYILEPGEIRQHPDNPLARQVTLPFALQERNQNCMHNGFMQFAMMEDNSLSDVKVQIASETCTYFKFNLTGSIKGKYQATGLTGADATRSQFRLQREARLKTRPIADLVSAYPGTSLDVLSGAGISPKTDITSYGFVFNDVHYRSNCMTRMGELPLCEEVSLPSYSLAKSLIAGLAAMRLEKLYPGSMQVSIAEYLPECRVDGNWGDVSMEQTLNLRTGNFNSPEPQEDEASLKMLEGFFLESNHKEKLSFSCNAWQRQAKPGRQWVYHSSDTYLAGAAMGALLRARRGEKADIYDDLVLPLWDDLALSPATKVILRSDDSDVHPYSAYGITLLADDIARLAVALNRGSFASHLNRSMFDSAMRRLPSTDDRPVYGKFYYRHGFWAYDAQGLLGCDRPVMVPFMSGYGGITVLMMPNDTVYYLFSDAGKPDITGILLESHWLRSMCPRAMPPRTAH